MKHISRFILIGLLIAVVIVIFSFTVRGAKISLYGDWIVSSKYDGSILYDEYPSSLLLSRNGKGSIDGMSMTWTTEDDRLIIAGQWGTIDYYYSVVESTLYLDSKPIHGLRNMKYHKV